MKIFISHQRTDSDLATYIAVHLRTHHHIDSYLDVVDNEIGKDGPALADHVREKLAQCDHLIAVLSDATAKSWWVPWEIGIATEKDFPLATYSNIRVELPDYLHKWPYLRSTSDLDKYAKRVRTATTVLATERFDSVNESVRARKSSTREFYRNLRADLGQ